MFKRHSESSGFDSRQHCFLCKDVFSALKNPLYIMACNVYAAYSYILNTRVRPASLYRPHACENTVKIKFSRGELRCGLVFTNTQISSHGAVKISRS